MEINKLSINACEIADGEWHQRIYLRNWHEKLRWGLICLFLKSLYTEKRISYYKLETN